MVLAARMHMQYPTMTEISWLANADSIARPFVNPGFAMGSMIDSQTPVMATYVSVPARMLRRRR